jgi:hypothetical protein
MSKINKAVKKYQDVAKVVATEVQEYGSKFCQLLRYHEDDLVKSQEVDRRLPTMKELENNPKLVWQLLDSDNEGVIDYINEERVVCFTTLFQIKFENDMYPCIIDDYPNLSWDKIEYLANNNYEWEMIKEIVNSDKDLSFSEFCQMAEFTKGWGGCWVGKLDYPCQIWKLNLPKWLYRPVDKLLQNNRRKDKVEWLIDELASEYNLGSITKDDVINIVLLASEGLLDQFFDFIYDLVDLNINYSIFHTLLPFYMVHSRRKIEIINVQYNKLTSRPYWCDENIWQIFNDSGVYKGAKILHQIKNELIKQYSPDNYFYVCMARDAVPLYNLLFESNLDSMLGVFSRPQIGDNDSVQLLKNEISIASEITGKKPVLLDVQGRGTIYDYLKQEGLDCEMIFGVSSNPDDCRYPLLITDITIGKKAIKYIEKLPQSNGRAEGVYQRSRCSDSFSDTLIVWGTRDPNAIGNEMKDWEILQFRGLFMETMGISHVHAGMIGNDNQQRMWGINKNYKQLPTDIEVGINVWDDIVDLIKSTRFKTQHEVGTSCGSYEPDSRRTDEAEQFGNTGLRTTFGIISNDRSSGRQYGNSHCRINIEKVFPYLYVTDRDTLHAEHNHYPATQLDSDNNFPRKEGRYRECQYNTLVTWDCVLEVIPC